MTNVPDTQTNGITLLPCPFCGGEAHAHEFSMHAGQFSCHMFYNPYWQVICSECRAAIGDFDTRAEAIAAWNTRSVTAAAVMGYQAAQAERTCGIEQRCEQLEGLCRDLYREGCYYWLLPTNDPTYARSAWCDDFRSRMDELGLLEVDDAES